MNILQEIAEKRIIAVEKAKKQMSLKKVERLATEKIVYRFPFEDNLRKPGIHFICEVKKASPSKGLIAKDFPYMEIAEDYERAGAAAISVLTEPEYFLGKNEYLKEICEEVNIPVLRKDFTVDEYQIYEAKILGASVILLICALLDDRKLKHFILLAHSLGLSALVETHDEEEVRRAVKAGARVIGANNRNLKDFTVDIHNSVKLRKLVPDHILFISESGISTPEDVNILRKNGTNGVLIGETLMRSDDKKGMIDYLRGEISDKG